MKGRLANADHRLGGHRPRLEKPGIIKTSENEAIAVIIVFDGLRRPGTAACCRPALMAGGPSGLVTARTSKAPAATSRLRAQLVMAWVNSDR